MPKVRTQNNLKIQNIVGGKDLRNNLEHYINLIEEGRSLIVVRRSKPVFTMSPPGGNELWEEVVDFTKIEKGGVRINELLSRL